jgi:hypothetical protein
MSGGVGGGRSILPPTRLGHGVCLMASYVKLVKNKKLLVAKGRLVPANRH